jgi:hypothetical protein
VAATISVVEGTGWSIETRIVGDHYAIIVGGSLVGVVAPCPGGGWGWFPLHDNGGGMRHLPIADALRTALREAERL